MTREDIIKPENLVYRRTPVLTDNVMHYCPGCGHGVVHRIIAEVIEEMGIQDNVIGISPVGCSVLGFVFYNFLYVKNIDGETFILKCEAIRNPSDNNFIYEHPYSLKRKKEPIKR